MVQKKIMISLPEEIVNDVDALVKAGFYRNRSDLIYSALITIEPLKTIVAKRSYQGLAEILAKMEGIIKPVHDGSLKLLDGTVVNKGNP